MTNNITPNFDPRPSGIRLEIKDFNHDPLVVNDVPLGVYESDSVRSVRSKICVPLDGEIIDYFYNNSTAVLEGGTELYIDGQFRRQAFDFNASYISLTSSMMTFNVGTPFSMSFWYRDTEVGISRNIVAKGNVAGFPNPGWRIWKFTDNKLYFAIYDSVANHQTVAPANGLSDGKWHFVCATYDGGTNASTAMSLVIDDDAPVFGGATTIGTFSNTHALTLGASSSGTGPFTGQLQFVNFWDFKVPFGTLMNDLYTAQNPYGFLDTTNPIRRDFNLLDVSVEVGTNDSYGTMIINIDNSDGSLLDGTDRKSCIIKPRNFVELYIGKTSSGLDRWFNGMIVESDIVRPQTNDSIATLSCIGLGIVLKERQLKLVINQDKTSDGETLDDTDTKTQLDNVINKMFTDTASLIDKNMPLITSVRTHFGATGLCGDCLNFKVPSINERYTTYASFISRIAGVGNVDWYVNPDGILVMRDGATHDSGMLFTSDLPSTAAQNWEPKDLGYIVNQGFGWGDTSIDGLYGWIHASGHHKPILFRNYEVAPDATDITVGEHIAFNIQNVGDLYKVALRLVKVNQGTFPDGSLDIVVTGGNGRDAFPEGTIAPSVLPQNWTNTTGSPITLTTIGHGLTTGDSIICSGNNSVNSINGTHVVTVTGADTFTVPINVSVQNNGIGSWLPLSDEITTMSVQGVDLIDAPIPLLSSGENAALDIIDAINSYAPTDTAEPKYTAYLDSDGKVRVRYPYSIAFSQNIDVTTHLSNASAVTIFGIGVYSGYTGLPITDDVRGKVSLNNQQLRDMGTTTPGEWIEIPIKPHITSGTGQSLFVITKPFGTVKTGPITSHTTANPTVITSASHGLLDGSTVTITGSTSTPTLNGDRVITVLTANTFSVPVVNPTANGGGTWTQEDSIGIDYKTGVGEYYVSTNGGQGYFIATGSINYRSYTGKTVATTVENVLITKRYPEARERLFPIRADFEEETVTQALIQASLIISRARRKYTELVVNVPVNRIQPASYCTVHDGMTGLKVQAKIVGYTMESHGRDISKYGMRRISLTLDEVFGK